MNDKEIDEAIESNPGGSNLEIALAIGSDEVAVARRRKSITAKQVKEQELKRLEEENAKKARDLAKEKEEAAAAKAKADAKSDPGHTKGNDTPTTPPPSSEPTPAPRRCFLQNENGSSVEIVVLDENDRVIVFAVKP